MTRKGFKMKLYPGMAKEYEKRHNELWPQMQDMIHEYGGKNYTIFLDQETSVLYGFICAFLTIGGISICLSDVYLNIHPSTHQCCLSRT